MNEIVPARAPAAGTLADTRPDLLDEAEGYARASLSEATRRASRADWRVFSAWCRAQRVAPLPASVETAAGFLADQARSKKVATLERYAATLGKRHKLRGHASPFSDAKVKSVLEGIRRKLGVAQTKKAPITIRLAAAAPAGGDKRALCERAVVLFGLATSFRGKEICSLDVGDLAWVPSGVEVMLRRSKTDQTGEGRVVAVPRLDTAPDLCPARALHRWLTALGTDAGPVFRAFGRGGLPTARRMRRATLNEIVKRAVATAGLDPNLFGSHSLRAGYVTEARKAGLEWVTIMEQTGHKRVETVKRYARGPAEPFRESRVAAVFEAAVSQASQTASRGTSLDGEMSWRAWR